MFSDFAKSSTAFASDSEMSLIATPSITKAVTFVPAFLVNVLSYLCGYISYIITVPFVLF